MSKIKCFFVLYICFLYSCNYEIDSIRIKTDRDRFNGVLILRVPITQNKLTNSYYYDNRALTHTLYTLENICNKEGIFFKSILSHDTTSATIELNVIGFEKAKDFLSKLDKSDDIGLRNKTIKLTNFNDHIKLTGTFRKLMFANDGEVVLESTSDSAKFTPEYNTAILNVSRISANTFSYSFKNDNDFVDISLDYPYHPQLLVSNNKISQLLSKDDNTKSPILTTGQLEENTVPFLTRSFWTFIVCLISGVAAIVGIYKNLKK